MASESSFVQPAIPRFDGHYDHWSMLMENFLRFMEYWTLVETGIDVHTSETVLTEAQRKTLEDQRLKDLKTKNYLFQAIDRAILETILKKDTAKDIWDSMKTKYQGTARVKRAQLQALRKESEILHMKEGESVNDYFARTLSIANKMRIHGENFKDIAVIEKILRSMTRKFDYVVCSIEESNDIDSLSIDVLQSSLLVHEQRMTSYVVEEPALKVSTYEGITSSRRGRGRGGFCGSGRGRGRQLSYNQGAQFDKASVECYYCHKLGHYQYECPDKETKVNFAETEGEILFMAHIDKKEFSSGDTSWKRGYQIPYEKQHCADNFTFSMIHHPEKGLIAEAKMTTNRMFPLHIQYDAQKCLSTRVQDPTWLWHLRYGHLSFKGLKTLHEKNMMEGLPKINCPTEMCEDCIVGKQHRDSFPQGKAWRAEQILQLVHSDICGPINPTSNGNKRYFITFIDDYSRKTWIYFLQEKSEAFVVFKSFKARVEKESGKYIQILRTDSGGEFNSHNFASFCELHGIRWQLIAAYTPQQNGVAERKNQMIMNMSLAEALPSSSARVSIPNEVQAPSSEPQRQRKRPSWMIDYVSGDELSNEDTTAYFALFAGSDPILFAEAVKEEKWKKAMDAEIQAIEKNETWERTNLLEGQKTIGVKWVYKTKLNGKGEIDKFKARLVVKGYNQEHGVDYQEIFAPVARQDTIRLVVSFAAQNSWPIFQLDVKSAFLNGKLLEQVYIEEPPGYVIKGNEHKVYRLKNALYGLKQAPRAWYSCIEAYFEKAGFNKCPYEHTLFIKSGAEGKILIVCLYVDDLIFTGNDEAMFVDFKNSMMADFDITDLGKMKYYLGIEVVQTATGYFIGQKKYAQEVFERFHMENCNPVVTPTEPGLKLSRDLDEERVDSTYFKQIVGSLMYLTATRPDIMYAVCLISRNPILHGRSKHIDVRYHFLRDLVAEETIDLVYCRSEDQVADILTKPLKLEAFEKLRGLLGIGFALKKLFTDGAVKREDLWITSKLWCTDHEPDDVLDYLDLYLIHWPVSMKKGSVGSDPQNLTQPNIPSTWKAMEALFHSGKARAIGVSNFSSKKLGDLLEVARIPPAVNQVELHPHWQQPKLHTFCKSKGVQLSVSMRRQSLLLLHMTSVNNLGTE
ncbi:uncharacterized protein LOC18775571 [Prunus persica]|uniref:uncharacterized protein LOC18775571 n=1 Tax=Prunus persica TaxID=3760 RepID=UPI0009AB8276|nr:uncharacterized protein LOC18775571 [Prunus persica]